METGIYTMPAEQYHADPCPVPSLSNSIAKVLLDQSPKHAWMSHPKLNPHYQSDEDSRFDLGSASHALLLEQSDANLVVIDAADWRTKAAKEARDAARAERKLPVLARHAAAIRKMVGAAQDFIAASPLRGVWQAGKPEQTVIWQDEGVSCRSRLDWLTDDRRLILDYKTTDSANPEVFGRQIARMGYDLQAAFYSSGLIANGCEEPRFVFLVQEIESPYACSLVELHSSYMEIAYAKYTRAVNLWRECVARNEWPAYSANITTALPPSWAMMKHETEMMGEE